MMKIIKLESGNIHIYKNCKFLFGFSEKGVEKANISKHLKTSNIKELKQIHSDQILFSSTITSQSEGDGIILDEKQTLAIIRTADCVPLFFYSYIDNIGGIIHCGWRGSAKGIEKNLVKILHSHNTSIENLHFFLGPHICKKCYEVGEELIGEFRNKNISEKIFQKLPEKGKFLLDLKTNITFTLISSGISKSKIQCSKICNYEDTRFDSYRREHKKNGRIYNFFIIFK